MPCSSYPILLLNSVPQRCSCSSRTWSCMGLQPVARRRPQHHLQNQIQLPPQPLVEVKLPLKISRRDQRSTMLRLRRVLRRSRTLPPQSNVIRTLRVPFPTPSPVFSPSRPSSPSSVKSHPPSSISAQPPG